MAGRSVVERPDLSDARVVQIPTKEVWVYLFRRLTDCQTTSETMSTNGHRCLEWGGLAWYAHENHRYRRYSAMEILTATKLLEFACSVWSSEAKISGRSFRAEVRLEDSGITQPGYQFNPGDAPRPRSSRRDLSVLMRQELWGLGQAFWIDGGPVVLFTCHGLPRCGEIHSPRQQWHERHMYAGRPQGTRTTQQGFVALPWRARKQPCVCCHATMLSLR